MSAYQEKNDKAARLSCAAIMLLCAIVCTAVLVLFIVILFDDPREAPTLGIAAAMLVVGFLGFSSGWLFIRLARGKRWKNQPTLMPAWFLKMFGLFFAALVVIAGLVDRRPLVVLDGIAIGSFLLFLGGFAQKPMSGERATVGTSVIVGRFSDTGGDGPTFPAGGDAAIDIAYRLTQADVASFLTHDSGETLQGHAPSQRRFWGLTFVLAILAIVCLATAFPRNRAAPEWFTTLLLLNSWLLLAIHVYRPWLRSRLGTESLLKTWRLPYPSKTLSEQQGLRITPEALILFTELFAWRTSWAAVDRIDVTAEHVFFYVNPSAAIVLPRRAFADEFAFLDYISAVQAYRRA
jgi:hypothetical protein